MKSGITELFQRSPCLACECRRLTALAGIVRGSAIDENPSLASIELLHGATAWFYAVRVLGPWDQYIGEVHDGVKAQLGDLYPRWLGTRELLLRGRNPYGPEVSHEIQMAYYGRIVDQENPGAGHKIIDEQRFAYPVYVVFLMAPAMYASFAEVQRWAPAVLALLAGLSVPMCLDLLGWRLRWQNLGAITLFTLSSPQIVQGLVHQQLAIVVGFLSLRGRGASAEIIWRARVCCWPVPPSNPKWRFSLCVFSSCGGWGTGAKDGACWQVFSRCWRPL